MEKVTAARFSLFRVAVALLFAASLSGCGTAEDRMINEIIEESHALGPRGVLSIRNVDGSVWIYGAKGSEVKVRAVKKGYSEERVQKIGVNIAAQSGRIDIDTVLPSKTRWGLGDRSGKVDYLIVAPEECSIEKVDLKNGVIVIEGMRGNQVNASLDTGKIFIRNCFADQNFSVISGNAEFVFDWWERRKFLMQAKVERGNIRAFVPTDATVRLKAESVHGRAAHNFGKNDSRYSGDGKHVEGTAGDGTTGQIQLKAVQGNINIREAK